MQNGFFLLFTVGANGGPVETYFPYIVPSEYFVLT